MASVGKGSSNTVSKFDKETGKYVIKTYRGYIVIRGPYGMACYNDISLIRKGTKVTFNGKTATVPEDKVIYVTDDNVLMAEDEPVVFDP